MSDLIHRQRLDETSQLRPPKFHSHTFLVSKDLLTRIRAKGQRDKRIQGHNHKLIFSLCRMLLSYIQTRIYSLNCGQGQVCEAVGAQTSSLAFPLRLLLNNQSNLHFLCWLLFIKWGTVQLRSRLSPERSKSGGENPVIIINQLINI